MKALDKFIKKERLVRFNQFIDQNTCQDSLYRRIAVSSWVEAHFSVMACAFSYALLMSYAEHFINHTVEG